MALVAVTEDEAVALHQAACEPAGRELTPAEAARRRRRSSSPPWSMWCARRARSRYKRVRG